MGRRRLCYAVSQCSTSPIALLRLAYPKSAPLMFFRASLRKPFEYNSSNRLRSCNHPYEPAAQHAFVRQVCLLATSPRSRYSTCQPASRDHSERQPPDPARARPVDSILLATNQARMFPWPGQLSSGVSTNQHGRVLAALHCHLAPLCVRASDCNNIQYA